MCRGRCSRSALDRTPGARLPWCATWRQGITRCIALRCPAQIRSAFYCAAVALLSVASVRCAARPRYGGVLRVEFRASTVTLNPRRWKPCSQELATNERLADLTFDRLATLDNYGRV